MSVSSRFSAFLENIKLTDLQVAAGQSSRESVVKVLNAHYWSSSSNTNNSNSWAHGRSSLAFDRHVMLMFCLNYPKLSMISISRRPGISSPNCFKK